MRQLTPDHRANEIKKGRKPETEAEEMYAAWLDDKDVPVDYEIAFSTYEIFAKREKVESLLIGNCPDDVLEEMLGFPKKSMEAYRELFFDLSMLHTDIDKLVFAEGYYKAVTGKDVPPVDNLILRGLNQGYQVLLLLFCNTVPDQMSAMNILKRVFAGAIFKATAVQYTGMGSGLDKRAMDHCQLALRILETMDKLKNDVEDTTTAYVKFVSVLEESGSVPKGFDASRIV